MFCVDKATVIVLHFFNYAGILCISSGIGSACLCKYFSIACFCGLHICLQWEITLLFFHKGGSTNSRGILLICDCSPVRSSVYGTAVLSISCVICGESFIFYSSIIKYIAGHIEATCLFIFASICNNLRNIFSGALSIDHIIVHVIRVLPAATMDYIKAVVVNDIVAYLCGRTILVCISRLFFCGISHGTTTHSRSAGCCICDQVVLKEYIVSAKDTTVAMTSLCVTRNSEAFINNTILYRSVLPAIGGKCLICVPAKGTMIDHKQLIISAPECIHGVTSIIYVFSTRPKTHIADNQIFRITNVCLIARNRHTISGSCLSRNGYIFNVSKG